MHSAFVTGANGFIGSHLVRELLARGFEVRCLVRHTSDISSLRGLPVALFIGDLREPETLVAPMQGVEYVFHLGAELLATDRRTFEQTNTQGTIHMLQAAERHAPRLKRFLYVSSETAAGPAEGPAPLDETAEPRPISWYGTSKKNAEDAVNAYAGRLPVTLVRPSAVYGEREQDVSQAFPLIERRIQPKLGVLRKYVVMIYVEDLVAGMLDAALSPNTLGQTYFLNHPEVHTTASVAKTVARAAGKSAGVMLPIPTFTFTLIAPLAELMHEFTRNRPRTTRDKAREIAQRSWVASPAKAKREFGWEARTSLLAGMIRTLAYYRAEQKQVRAMPLERPPLLWLKYVICSSGIGILIEVTSRLGGFYTFDPWWLVFVIALGGFGLTLGTVAMLLRKMGDLYQFILPTILVGAVEAANVVWFHAWTFAPGWPFGITDPWARAVVLGCAGGVVVLIVNAIARSLYKRRLRLG